MLPRRVEVLAGVRVRSASAGDAHSLVVTEEGELYSFGEDRYGKLSHGDAEDEHSPTLVDALRHVRIAAAAAGTYQSLALAGDGTVFSWGGKGNGQLSLGRSGGNTLSPQRVTVALSGL